VKKSELMQAACLGEDPELFFPNGISEEAQEQARQAKAICLRCPIRDECLAEALELGDQWAVRGATTPEERGVKNYRRAKVAA